MCEPSSTMLSLFTRAGRSNGEIIVLNENTRPSRTLCNRSLQDKYILQYQTFTFYTFSRSTKFILFHGTDFTDTCKEQSRSLFFIPLPYFPIELTVLNFYIITIISVIETQSDKWTYNYYQINYN